MGRDVSGSFGDDDSELALSQFAESHGARHRDSLAPSMPHLARIARSHREHEARSFSHFHRVTVTVVPSPGAVLMSNSFMSRLLPPSPNPMPCLLVNPSVRACLMSAIPGPLSEKLNRMPLRMPSTTSAISSSPPPPCSRVLRPNSLAAVTIFV